MIDRERLRVRLLDILGVFVSREVADMDPRLERWLDMLMESDLEPAEVERLNARVGQLKLAFDLEKGVERELEADAMHLEDALRARMARDVHIVAVEAERDELRARVEAVRAIALALYDSGADFSPAEVLDIVGRTDTPSTPNVDAR